MQDRQGKGADDGIAVMPAAVLPPAELAALLLAQSRDILVIAQGAALEWDYASPSFADFAGCPTEAALGTGWQALVHPEDLPPLRQSWAAACAAGSRCSGLLRLRAAAGTYSWFEYRLLPEASAAAPARRWVGCFADVQEQRALAGQQAALLLEMRRRTASALALVRSVTSRTLASSEDAAHVAAHLPGRIGALGRTQLLLTRRGDGCAVLEEMVREELLAQEGRQGTEITVTGPEVLLPGEAAAMLCLALHELATNSAKFGALSIAEGRIIVLWQLLPAAEGPPRLVLDWLETGPPPLEAAPSHLHIGFGRELIEQGLPYELDAVTSLDIRGAEVRCHIELPLPAAKEALPLGGAARP